VLSHPDRRRLQRLRWTAFVLVAAGYLLAFFHRMAPAAIAEDLQRAFNASGVALGSLAASYFYIYTLMQVPTGVLADTWGVRRLVTVGALIAGVGSIWFGIADSLSGASLGRLLVGLGISVMFLSLMKLNSVWFHERHFGTIGGFTILLGNLGAVLSAAPLVALLTVASWREIFVVIGVATLALGVLTGWLVRSHPGEAGLPSLRELYGEAPHAPHTGHWFAGLTDVVRNRDTWPGFWLNLGVSGTFFSFAGLWAIPFLRDVYHMDRPLAALHTTLLLIGFSLSSFFIGTLSDRLHRRKPVILAAVLFYLACWLPWLAGLTLPPLASLTVFTLMGVGAAGFTLSWACAKEVNRAALSGMATGVVNTGAFLGAALLQPLVGWVMDLSWDGAMHAGVRVYAATDYRWGNGVMFAAACLGVVGALFIRETHCRHVPVRERH
jgi:sugar phosphate permease